MTTTFNKEIEDIDILKSQFMSEIEQIKSDLATHLDQSKKDLEKEYNTYLTTVPTLTSFKKQIPDLTKYRQKIASELEDLAKDRETTSTELASFKKDCDEAILSFQHCKVKLDNLNSLRNKLVLNLNEDEEYMQKKQRQIKNDIATMEKNLSESRTAFECLPEAERKFQDLQSDLQSTLITIQTSKEELTTLIQTFNTSKNDMNKCHNELTKAVKSLEHTADTTKIDMTVYHEKMKERFLDEAINKKDERLEDFGKEIDNLLQKSLTPFCDNAKQSFTDLVDTEKESFRTYFNKLKQDISTTTKHPPTINHPHPSATSTPKTPDGKDSSNHPTTCSTFTVKYLPNTNGYFHKLINGILQPDHYKEVDGYYYKVPQSDVTAPYTTNQYHRLNGSYRYNYKGEMYNLDMKGWNKVKLSQTCPTKDDLYLFYNSLMLQARTYGILLTPLEEMSAATGICPINRYNCDTALDTIKEMGNALYQKLIETDTFGNKYPQAMDLCRTHASDHNGFKVLTKLLRKVHPRMNANCDTIQRPKFLDCTDIHDFVKKYRNHLLYEMYKERPREYTDKEQVEYILSELDDRFKESITQVNALMNNYLHDPYPPELLVQEDLVQTILQYIPEEEQRSLTNNNEDDAIINTFNMKRRPYFPRNSSPQQRGKPIQRRPFKSTICSICGMAGHDGPKDGCDFMCKSVNVNNYLSTDKRATPKIIDTIMAKFKQRNKERIQNQRRDYKIQQLELAADIKEQVLTALNDTESSDISYGTDEDDEQA